jgi:hypothetical protein
MAKSSYSLGQLCRYRVTLELNVLEDFDANKLDWNKLLKLEPKEKVSAYVEDLNS